MIDRRETGQIVRGPWIWPAGESADYWRGYDTGRYVGRCEGVLTGFGIVAAVWALLVVIRMMGA